jgi:DNA adenine methylase
MACRGDRIAMAKQPAKDIPKALRRAFGGITVPLNWYGSKGRLAKRIANLLPEHTVYVEVFGGTAAVLLAKPISPVEVYNDIDGELVNFFTVLREKPGELIARCFLQPYAHADFLKYRSEPTPNDPVERAARFMFLVNSALNLQNYRHSCFATHISMGSLPEPLSAADAWASKVNKLIWFALRFRDVIIENRDFEEIFHIYDRPEAVFFCDPPYTQGAHAWALAEHLRLVRCLKNLKGKFLVTIDDSSLSRQLYKDFNLVAVFDSPNGMASRGSRQGMLYRHLCFANYNTGVKGCPPDDEPETKPMPHNDEGATPSLEGVE